LYEESAPFFDNNYSPGAMAYLELDRTSKLSPAIRAFVQHESNGRDGAASRSWNQVGGGVDLGDPERSLWYATATGWIPFGVADENPALPDFAVRGEVKLYFQPWIGKKFRLDQRGFSVALRTLGKHGISNVEAAGYLGFGSPSGGQVQPRVTPSLMLHVFRGYAENLLTYQERRTAVRMGFAFIR
jgi:outer membrane phospholipase A